MSELDLDAESEALLEELLSEVRSRIDRDVGEKELLHRILANASPEPLVTELRDEEFDGLTDEAIERFHSGTSAWGVDTSEDDIDEIIYGE